MYNSYINQPKITSIKKKTLFFKQQAFLVYIPAKIAFPIIKHLLSNLYS